VNCPKRKAVEGLRLLQLQPPVTGVRMWMETCDESEMETNKQNLLRFRKVRTIETRCTQPLAGAAPVVAPGT